MATWTRRHTTISVVVAVLVVAGIVTWLRWPSPRASAPARERHYRSTTACLLTDDKGLEGDIAKAAWAGMQEASAETLIKSEYLVIVGPQTTANAVSFFNTLGVQKCTVIIAAGPTPVAAMVEGYPRFPNIHHVAIGGDTKGKPITKVEATTADGIQSAVHHIVAGFA